MNDWYGISEKTLTLDVAKKVEALLKQKNIKVLMTRRADQYVSIQDRASIANKHKNETRENTNKQKTQTNQTTKNLKYVQPNQTNRFSTI